MLASVASAQPATKCFKAYNQQGQEAKILCVGQEYEFQDCENEVPDENEYYVFNYKKGTPITNASDEQRHTYTTPGTYRVLQVANYGSNTLTDTISVVFEVKASPTPTFIAQACANGTVSVTITDSNYNSYTIDFGDGRLTSGAKPDNPVQHQYAITGTYTIKVSGSYTGGTCVGESTAKVTTLPMAPVPVIRSLRILEQASSGQLQLDLDNLQAGFDYIIDWWNPNASSPGYFPIDTIRNISQANLSHRLQNVNTTEGILYRVRPIDACGSSFPDAKAVSSIALEVTTAEERATVKWQSMPHAQRFELYRNGVLLQTLAETVKQYIDTDVVCGQPYIYELRGIAPDGSVSFSAAKEVQIESTATPDAPYLLTTYNQNNEVELLLQMPQDEQAQQIKIESSVSGASYQVISEGVQTAYTDALSTPAQICYRATFTNTCGNTSALSNVSCPVFLQAQKQRDGAAVSLEWTDYEGFPRGVRQYMVELLDENGSVVSSYPASGNAYTDRTLSSDLPQLRYRVKGTAHDGTSTYSNVVVLEQELSLHIPSGFTPNGDGLNDVFEIKGRFFSSYTLRIYNRLGTVVYEGTAADAGWDGTYQGELLPAGAYAYELSAEAASGASRQVTGTITLLR